ncbi:MAG: response regulator [Bacilli bacterium]|nr:response regulator [Bacilli bacterium]
MMPGSEYLNVVGETLLKTFSDVYVVDLRKDIVNTYIFENNYVKFKEARSFLEFVESEKTYITSSDTENYIKIISGNFEGEITFSFQKKESYSYDNYIMVAKKVNYDNNQLIIIMTSKVNEFSKSKEVNDEEIQKMVKDFSESILKIYNTIDIAKEENPGFNYIKSLLEELTRNYPSLNKKLEMNIIAETNKTKNSLLIVDDDTITRNILKKAFEKDFNIVTASNGKEAIDLLESNYNSSENILNYVGIFLDIAMPVLDGFAVLEFLKDKDLLNKLPVIIISAAEDRETRQKVYSYNIADMLEKPFNLEIIRLRINNFIKLYKNSNSLTSLIINKDKEVNSILEKLENVYLKDNEERINLVSKLTEVFALKYLEINPNCGLTLPLINKLCIASKYYDIGKLIVPNKVLNNENLSIDEEKKLSDHSSNGALLIKRLFYNKDQILNDYAYNICLYHHESYDGTGYPKRISGKDIPLYVSIVSLAIIYANYILDEKETNYSAIAANIIALENQKFSSEIINTFRLVLNDFASVCENLSK